MKKGQKVRLNDKFDKLLATDVISYIKVSDWRKIFNENKGYGKIKKNLYDDFCEIVFPKYSSGYLMYKMFLK